MILEHFSVENWSCIRRIVVENLPVTGVVVFHGPNGTGKSSIVAALRAALMDYAPASTDRDLRRWFPTEGEPPRVTVGFRVGAIGYRLTKQFKKNGECRLEKQAAGGWELLTKSPAEVHDEAKRLAGGSDSTRGLYQLLWLDQAQFKLPTIKDFDAGVQADLRRVLGVMQTPLDDIFIGRVRERREVWYAARGKSSEPPKLKPKCQLSEKLTRLETYQQQLVVHEARHAEMRRSVERADNLERQIGTFDKNLATQTQTVNELRAEADRCQKRRTVFELARHRVNTAATVLATSEKALAERNELVGNIAGAQRGVVAARSAASAATEQLTAAQASLKELRQLLGERKGALRAAGQRLADAEHLERIRTNEAAATELRTTIASAERMAQDLENQRIRDAAEPIPSEKELNELQKLRSKSEQLRAEIEAASMHVTIVRNDGCPGKLALDGGPDTEVSVGAAEHRVRHRAELKVPGWGSVTLMRGTDGRDLDEVVADLSNLEDRFALGIAPFAIAPAEKDPLTTLQQRVADRKARQPFAKKNEADLKSLAPDGVPSLRGALARLENELRILSNAPTTSDATDIKCERVNVAECQKQFDAAEKDVEAETTRIESPEIGLRAVSERMNHDETKVSTTFRVLTDLLAKMPSAVEAQGRVDDAKKEVADADLALTEAALTEEEETIPERLNLAETSADNLTEQLDLAKREFHELRGSLKAFAGLHQDRADAAARVEVLKREVEREQLEAQAYDRLYQLFEECREKQLGTVVGPITNRVGRWMQLAGIGDYRGIEFNDAFLPHRLTGQEGRGSLPLDHESTGTYEQIALMARLALGTVLSAPGEPTVAVLDDPLTHSDASRVERMRAVLRSAAKGDGESTPPAGPLQILVFTCHPEWFSADAARSIDLGSPAVLQRTTTL